MIFLIKIVNVLISEDLPCYFSNFNEHCGETFAMFGVCNHNYTIVAIWYIWLGTLVTSCKICMDHVYKQNLLSFVDSCCHPIEIMS